jgi:hypothetical protein
MYGCAQHYLYKWEAKDSATDDDNNIQTLVYFICSTYSRWLFVG